MNFNLSCTPKALSGVFKNLFLIIFVLGFLTVFNLQAQAQIAPPIECIALDDLQNTELPNKSIELDALGGNPGPVNVLDNGAPGVIGNIRNITYGPTNRIARLVLSDGIISNNTDALATSPPLDLLYNADGTGLELDFTDINEFTFTLLSLDKTGTSLEIILTDSENNTAQTAVMNLPNTQEGADFPVELIFPLSEFTGIGGLELSNIFSIEFRWDSSIEGTDYAFSFPQICKPITRDVPTLSEWGLIAMAGVLGIVGFMVMRRRKLAVN